MTNLTEQSTVTNSTNTLAPNSKAPSAKITIYLDSTVINCVNALSPNTQEPAPKITEYLESVANFFESSFYKNDKGIPAKLTLYQMSRGTVTIEEVENNRVWIRWCNADGKIIASGYLDEITKDVVYTLTKGVSMNVYKLTAVQWKAIQEGAKTWLNSDHRQFTCIVIREHISDDVLYSRIFRVMHNLFVQWLKDTGKTELSIYTPLFINKYHEYTEKSQYENAVKETRTEFMTWVVNL